MDPRTPVSPEDRFAYELKRVLDRLDALEAPSGTSIYQTVDKLRALVDDIQQQLADFITNDVGALVTAAVTNALAGNISIGGNLTVAGAVTMPGARATDLTSAPSRVNAWIAGDGRVGHT
ncbi:hypothetical protein [Microbacterium oxydans]|uniref:hypothetical protein n=1 Tax=Microbacterium oxydans TaxID=82380 RepID=UPI000F8F9CF0|nr:hypothetical protein [Microbacterium oxydans]AZS48173.1 hypothetical protein CVS53_02889 [Microbacterium oxydans]